MTWEKEVQDNRLQRTRFRLHSDMQFADYYVEQTTPFSSRHTSQSYDWGNEETMNTLLRSFDEEELDQNVKDTNK